MPYDEDGNPLDWLDDLIRVPFALKAAIRLSGMVSTIEVAEEVAKALGYHETRRWQSGTWQLMANLVDPLGWYVDHGYSADLDPRLMDMAEKAAGELDLDERWEAGVDLEFLNKRVRKGATYRDVPAEVVTLIARGIEPRIRRAVDRWEQRGIFETARRAHRSA